MIDWSDSKVEEKNGKKRKKFAAYCPVCGHKRYLEKSKAVRDSLCLSCTGRKGYMACVKKYGPDWSILKLQEYRLTHPSAFELEVQQALDKAGVHYEREVIARGPMHYLIDFWLPGDIALEAHGRVHELFDLSERDEKKRRYLIDQGYTYVEVTPQSLDKVVIELAERIA